MTNIARAYRALADALNHVDIGAHYVNSNEHELLVSIPEDNGDETLRLLRLCELAERMRLPAPTPAALRGPGARAQTVGSPGYCPDVTVVLWTPVTAGVRQVAS